MPARKNRRLVDTRGVRIDSAPRKCLSKHALRLVWGDADVAKFSAVPVPFPEPGRPPGYTSCVMPARVVCGQGRSSSAAPESFFPSIAR